MDPVKKILGKNVHPDVFKAMDTYNEMKTQAMSRYNIDDVTAGNLVSQASEYNPKNKSEAFRVMDKIMRGK